MKFKKRIEQFITVKQAETRPATMRYYKAKLGMIERYLGELDDEEINELVIADFTNKQKSRNPNISPRTLNYYRQIIVRIIKDTTNRKIKIKKLKEIKPFIKSVDEKNIYKILNYYRNSIDKWDNHKYLLIIKLLLDTGVRVRELVNIEVKNINLSFRAIQLDRTKTGVSRIVFFSEETKMILYSYMDKHIRNQKYLFSGPTPQRHMNCTTIYRALVRLQIRLGIDQSISAHKFRHSFAKTYIKKGGDLSTLQSLLGHTELSTTEMYLRFNIDELKQNYDQTMNKIE